MRALKIASAAIATVLVVAALLLIIGIPSGFLTSAIQDRVERETGYRLSIAGATRIGLWPSLNVTMNDATLEGPKDRDAGNRLTVGSIEADMTLRSVWSGRPEITRLAIIRPVLNVPLLRERNTAPKPASSRPAASPHEANAPAIERITVNDGTIVFSHLRDRVERRIEGINADEAQEVKKNVSVPVLVTGGFQTASFIRKCISEGCCDGVAIARPLVANNDLVKIYASGKDLPDKPCTYCNKCAIHAIADPLGCYELSRYDGDYDRMIKEIMTVFTPA